MANLVFVGSEPTATRRDQRWLNTGRQVIGYNRAQAQSEPVIPAAMQQLHTPRKAAEAAGITFSMVCDTAALSSVAQKLGN